MCLLFVWFCIPDETIHFVNFLFLYLLQCYYSRRIALLRVAITILSSISFFLVQWYEEVYISYNRPTFTQQLPKVKPIILCYLRFRKPIATVTNSQCRGQFCCNKINSKIKHSKSIYLYYTRFIRNASTNKMG